MDQNGEKYIVTKILHLENMKLQVDYCQLI